MRSTRSTRSSGRWRVAERIAEYDIFFLETPLWTDDIDGYARLAAASPVPIAAGEWLSSRHEFAQLIERSAVDVVQPDIGRVGGFTEARRVCDMAADAGLRVVPHAWKTGISVAAAAHLATVTPHMPFFEFLPAELCESRLRKELTVDELVFDERPAGDPRRGRASASSSTATRSDEFAEAAARVA